MIVEKALSTTAHLHSEFIISLAKPSLINSPHSSLTRRHSHPFYSNQLLLDSSWFQNVPINPLPRSHRLNSSINPIQLSTHPPNNSLILTRHHLPRHNHPYCRQTNDSCCAAYLRCIHDFGVRFVDWSVCCD
jgi:hypothetical protein